MILIKFVSFYRSYTNQQRTRVKLDCPWQGFKNCFEFEATHTWALITYLVHKREVALSPLLDVINEEIVLGMLTCLS